MSFTKKINVNDGSGRKFEEQTTAELPLDMKPEVGSFNAITSDAVARAVAGASGEVPQVTESDNGKVLKAIYGAGGPAVEWGEAQGGVPEYSSADEGKVLGVITDGVEDTPALGWVEQQGGTVDQTYDATSTNAQSGVAVSGAIAEVNAVPASTASDENKVLTVNASGSPVWATAQGGGGGGMLPPIAANTVRCRFASGYTPSMGTDGNVCVDVANNIWDITDNTGWAHKFDQNQNLLEVLGARLVSVSNTSIENMFDSCSNLTRAANIELNNDPNIGNIVPARMFEGCGSLEYVHFSKCVIDDDASYMFYHCGNLVDVGGLDLSSCSNVSRMFSGCAKLRHGYTGSLMLARNLSYMYMGCTNLLQAAPSMILEYLDTGSLDYMFCDCRSLVSLPNLTIYNTSSLTCESTFASCCNAVSGLVEAYTALSALSPDSYVNCFDGCGIFSYSGRQDRAQIPAAWGGDGT